MKRSGSFGWPHLERKEQLFAARKMESARRLKLIKNLPGRIRFLRKKKSDSPWQILSAGYYPSSPSKFSDCPMLKEIEQLLLLQDRDQKIKVFKAELRSEERRVGKEC